MEKVQTVIELKDLAAAVQIIDVACQRGAIRGEEMAEVGAVRNRLVKFLNSQSEATSEPESNETNSD